jgi:hypothetical protein
MLFASYNDHRIYFAGFSGREITGKISCNNRENATNDIEIDVVINGIGFNGREGGCFKRNLID